jgi:hypothetical protein
MVRLLAMLIVLLKTMGELGGQNTLNLTVDPEAAPASTTGNEPGPDPEQVVTAWVAALASPVGSTAKQMALPRTMLVPTR